jgi:hypothetical protein
MANLGSRQATGVHDLSNPLGSGKWTVAFTPQVLNIFAAFEVYHIAVTGPIGSTFRIYQDTTFYDAVARGDLNSWDPSQPMHVTPGRTLYFYYDSTITPAPQVTIYCREPSL